MSRSRRWWHKTNHDRLMRDQFVWNLPDEALGLLKRLECMVGSTERGHETGFLCNEDGEKVSRAALTLLLSRGDEELEAKINRRLELLANAKEVCPRALERGHVRLLKWQADQDMPATQDSDRKRGEADEELSKEAEAFRPHLERLFAKLGNRPLSDAEVLAFIKRVRGGYSKTQVKFFEFLYSEQVLARDADGMNQLASLAPATPAGAGVYEAGATFSTGAGAGKGNFPNGKFPVEIDPESRMGIHSYSQLDSAGGGNAGASESSGSTFSGSPHCERAGKRPAHGWTPIKASGNPPNGFAGDFHDLPHCERQGEVSQYVLWEPGDAYQCSNPLAASIEFLRQCPGWQEKRYGNTPASPVVLRSRWKALCDDPSIGQAEAERIWRTCLDQAITDRLDRQGWRCWVAIFQNRVKRQVEILKPMPAADGNDAIGLLTGNTGNRINLR